MRTAHANFLFIATISAASAFSCSSKSPAPVATLWAWSGSPGTIYRLVCHADSCSKNDIVLPSVGYISDLDCVENELIVCYAEAYPNTSKIRLAKYDSISNKILSTILLPSSAYVNCKMTASDSAVWIAATDGMIVVDLVSEKINTVFLSEIPQKYSDLVYDNGVIFYVSTSRKLIRLDTDSGDVSTVDIRLDSPSSVLTLLGASGTSLILSRHEQESGRLLGISQVSMLAEGATSIDSCLSGTPARLANYHIQHACGREQLAVLLAITDLPYQSKIIIMSADCDDYTIGDINFAGIAICP
jgi:hypothetical protein